MIDAVENDYYVIENNTIIEKIRVSTAEILS